jgi:SAM-dependent methyltransferase
MSKSLCITIDTEPDCDIHWKRSNPLSFESVLSGISTILRPVWNRYGIKPVYFVSPEVVQNDDCCEVLKKEIQFGAEIGSHLHSEYIEPEKKYEEFAGTTSKEHPCFAYSTEIELAKIKNLTELIAKKLGVKPVSYRAARYGADLDTIKCLEKLDYKVDSSVTPEINWSYQGGPDHSKAPKQPYFISRDDYYSLGSSKILEIPISISKKRFFLLADKWFFYRWLRSTHMTVTEMKILIKEFIRNYNAPVLNMMFHSMEIIPGKTPFVRSKFQQKLYLNRLEKIIKHLKEKGFQSKTLEMVYNEKSSEIPQGQVITVKEHDGTLQQKAYNQLRSFLAECRIEDPRNKKILEIGFKNGLFLNQCRKAGLRPTGIEINKKYYEAVKSKYPDLDVILYDGGTIPLPDESFDFVVSYQVLEHVTSIEHIFSECIRILKPGGIMYHVCPNYGSFYEGHYNVVWLPFFSKTLGRLYLKLLRRYNSYYETLNIIKPKLVAQPLHRHQDDITIISLGRTEFINKFKLEQIKKVNQKLLQKILKLLLRLPLVKKWILELICQANLYYPITIIAMKKVKNINE